MKATEVTFYTQPCAWMNDGTPETIVPYDMIAGMSVAGQELWADRTQLAGEAAYCKADTEAVTCVLPEVFAERSADYFYDFYVNQLHPYRVSHVMGDREHLSNCHRFATTLLTGKPQTFLGASALVFEMFEHSIPAPDQQQFGELAMLGMVGKEEEEYVAHTSVSLGDVLPGTHLQVVTLGGNLGLSSVTDMLSFYRSMSLDVDAYSPQEADISIPRPEFTDHVRKIVGTS